ncbi:protein farnesyltransferase subunit beta [Plasmodium brasilianum]|uniref:Protein farnesyltransferase subunit beta n=2 Tax=Plasmodium (Plasmodium) TaxID=418103 RepID=A0A1A8W4C4_PLAMA|nr:protein farnesyltransferase subunit beta, putative [Plasmodium malariae]KAI4838578.1 protein farnesyltransferase subunit beta [Plasmodium brasilianum]SBS86005.1 farnesyltransferase beta subunit [Plasmodium malariae]SCN12988.1 protein farnesyltransferase subunit beta, putative [Plasmodium malariae]
MDKYNTYMLRYNKKKICVELLFELIKYEKSKNISKVDFENDEFYNYLESIIKLLFNYVFNINKENDIYDTENKCRTNFYSSSSESLSDILINSSEEDNGPSEFFSFPKINTKEEKVIFLHDNYENNNEFECFQKNTGDNNKDLKENNLNTNIYENNDANANVNYFSKIHDQKDNENERKLEKKTQEELFYRKNDNYMSYFFFFNFHLNCNKNTQTIKEKKKVEKQILSIYYKSFSSTIIDILLNNSKVGISDIILFFIFDNVGNLDDISVFFSEGFYTFERIYAYIHNHVSCNHNISLNKGENEFIFTRPFLNFEKFHQNEYENENPKVYCKDYEGASKKVKHHIKDQQAEAQKDMAPFNNEMHGIIKESGTYYDTLKGKNEKNGINDDEKKRINKKFTTSSKYENEEDNISIYVNEILKEKIIDSYFSLGDMENNDISKLNSAQIIDDILIIENFKFLLNKSSILLNKFISILNIELEKQKHFKFCLDIFFLKNLKLNFLEASKPWIFYWCIHAIYILYNDLEIEQKLSKGTFSYIKKCVFLYLNKIKNEKDAFGGGLNQYTHIATTYATVCVFIYLHDEENNFLSFLDKKKLHTYILKLKCKDGSFRVHKNGEIDMRGTYCAISICSMCHILTNEVKKNVEKYIMSCQNYEGGFTSEKFQESHGGYTYCALATLCILGKIKKINLNNLMIWLINKQGNLEGAFMGRTNKLVDACYSFWIGSIFFLINEIYILKNFFQKYKKEKSLIHEKFKIVRKTGCTHLNELKTFGVTDLQKKDSNSEKNEQTVLYSTKQNKTCNTTSYNTSTYNNNNGNSNSNNNDNYCNKNESLTFLTEKKLIELEIMGKNKNFSFITSSILNEQFHFKNYKNKFMENKVLFNVNYLKLYLLLCSQGNNGGMKDKPNEKVDYYHTCYALSGLSLIENYILSNMHYSEDTYNNKDNINKLNKIHILYNITVSKVLKSYIYFSPNFPLSENKINHKVGKGAYLYLKRLIY